MEQVPYEDNTPREDGLHSTSIETNEDCVGHAGCSQRLEEVKVLEGLFNGSCCVFCLLGVRTDSDAKDLEAVQ